ncbi:MAG: MBOAT family O-acyltransferase [bacterium]
MIFTTPEFVLFFVAFFVIHFSLRGAARKWWLLAASYFFYGSWNAVFLLLIIGSTLVDYFVAHAIAASADQRRRDRLMWLSVAVNLGALGFFKYCNFFVDSFAALLGAVGVEASLPVLDVLLPVGISFYTFQTMSYTIDVWRGEQQPTTSFLDFALYVAFFPQLVAGPIERAAHLLPQIARLPSLGPIMSGFGLIALGCFKKAVIADHIAGVVDVTYADVDATHAPALWIGTYAFAVQIYCDFSGYSDIAVGVGRLLGLDIVENFKSPYASAGPSEFWRRWHISLSSWLRDYLYIPLGGNRGGWFYVRRNLMLTMLLGGLWHGAAWNFVLWGLWHGLLLIIFRPRWMARLIERVEGMNLAARIASQLVRRVVFFHLVCLGWALFRATSLADCAVLFQKLLTPWRWDLGGWLAAVETSGEGRWLLGVGALIGGVVLVQNVWTHGQKRLADAFWRWPAALRFVVLVAVFYACVLLAPEKPPPFIYFQF